MPFCVNCGKEIPEKIKFCSFCGTPIGVDNNSIQSEKNKTEQTEKAREIEYIKQEIKSAEKKMKYSIIMCAITGVCVIILGWLMSSMPRLHEISWIIWLGVISCLLNGITIFTSKMKIDQKKQQLYQRES